MKSNKKRTLRQRLPLAVICILFASAAASAQMVGGYKTIAKADTGAVAAANFAVRTQAERTQDQIELGNIVNAESQLVAGTNFRLCLQINGSADPFYVQIVVYVDLKRNYRLTSWANSKCGPAAAPVSAPMVGGYRAVAKTDADVIAAARFAVKAESEKTNTEFTLKYIKTAERQVVQGTNYRLCMRVSADGDVPVFVQAIVYYDLKRHYTLTRWADSACGGN